jgi:hypothetical protein
LVGCRLQTPLWIAVAHTRLFLDNTNPDPDTRLIWVDLAKKFKVPIRCVWFKTPIHICEHNDAVRSVNAKVSAGPGWTHQPRTTHCKPRPVVETKI